MTNQVLFEESLDRLFARNNVSVRRRFLDESSERSIHLLEAGRGEPMLFIHGGLSYAGSFTPLLQPSLSPFASALQQSQRPVSSLA